MQHAKDSFYMALRSRLASLNPERTCVVRGSVRPGIVVEEAEAPFAQPPNDIFVVRWLGLGVEIDLASSLFAAECEVAYGTCGCQAYGGLDRGRVMAAMDAELTVMMEPLCTPKINHTVNPQVTMPTQVFWDEPVFTPIVAQRDRLSRSARVLVYSYKEPGK